MRFESAFLDALSEKVLIFDGAMGTQLQGAGLSASDFTLAKGSSRLIDAAIERMGEAYLEGCNELLVLNRPDVVEQVHSNYLEAGADIIETNTFGSTSIVLADYSIPELTHEISFEAARIARAAADRYSTSEKPRFVAGAIGPGTKLISLGQVGWEELESTYTDSFCGLIEGGADLLLLETLQDLLMIKAGVVSANKAMAKTGKRLPLLVQLTIEQNGTLLVGTEIGAAVNMLECYPDVVGIGLNCATGPVEMSPHVRFLSQNSTRAISVQPNAGLPIMENGQAVYRLSPKELAEHHHHFVTDFGIAMAGGCCGTTPEHIKAISDMVGGRKHSTQAHWQRVRHLFPGFDFIVKSDEQAKGLSLIGCSSMYQFVPYKQDLSFLIIGEKTNANGSKAFREMLAKENWEGLTELARELEAEGSHVLDVCTAFVGRNEASDMRTLLGRYNQHVSAAIMIDSTETPVIEAALQSVAGKPIINSVNFEDGGQRLHQVLSLAKRYGAAVVGLTIDEQGMAKTLDHKLEIAERIIEQTRAYGVPDHDLFIDFLTFTLGSGDEEFRKAGKITVEAIRELKNRHPLVNTVLGVSNISFGLKPATRQVLNSAFLHFALEAGLSSAIVHFSKIIPENKIEPQIWKIAEDLVFDRREFKIESQESTPST